MKINAHSHTIVLLVLSAILLFWLGRLSVQFQLSQMVPPVRQLGETNDKIPMVNITDIRNGKLFGTVNKEETRLKYRDEVAVPDDANRFELDIQDLGFASKPDPKLKVPPDAKFVASENGKYYYALDEATAKRLNPATRLFFSTEGEAVDAGYQKRTR